MGKIKPPSKAKEEGPKSAGAGGKGLYYGAAGVAVIAVLWLLLAQPSPKGVCGDGLCGFEEDAASCPKDCKGTCGDSFCSRSETCEGAEPPKQRLTPCARDCGHCKVSRLPTCAAVAGMDAQHNSSMLWGTYRPHLFCGVRTRTRAPVIASIMWHGPTNYDEIRHDVTDDGIERYGWLEHDGRSFGHQEVLDSANGLALTTTWVKNLHGDAAAKGGDWALRITGKKGWAAKPTQKELTLVLHLGTYGKKNVLGAAEVSQDGAAGGDVPLSTRTGRSAATGSFTVSMFSQGKPSVGPLHFSARIKDEYHSIAERFLRDMYNPSIHKAREGKDTGPVRATIPNEHRGDEANVALHQVILPVPFQLDIVFTSHAAHGFPDDVSRADVVAAARKMQGSSLDELIQQRREAFSRRFDETFSLQGKSCSSAEEKQKGIVEREACDASGKYTESALKVGKVALSQVMGGMNYVHGTWFKSTPPFFNNSVEQKAVVSFSASPCRNGFARGFLWDEGFHQLIVARWDPAISMDAILHWFDLMQPDGWIPREHFIGAETRKHIEARWWTQNPNHANPPTLLLAIETLIDEGHASKDFLACLKPKLLTWLNWFRRTQKGFSLYSFRWSGRVQTDGIWHTLSSGLDDYPRSNHSSTAKDRHLDLQSWVAMMLRVMSKIDTKLGVQGGSDGTEDYSRGLQALIEHTDAIHWDNETKSYADRGLMRYNKQVADGFVSHYGYVTLFPLILRLIPAGARAEATMAIMQSKGYLRSKAGLRSLSFTAPGGGRDSVYGTQEDYWRGKVWININYLALQALYLKYAQGSEAGKALYSQLRSSVVDTIVFQYVKHGFLFEQYDDKTGDGLKHKPFAGWTALVLLIMAEKY